ncbi:hypothetical protein HAV20_13765 [Pseudomonas sp. D-134-1]|nr:hypothetical protein [Stutzerimonas degradans]
MRLTYLLPPLLGLLLVGCGEDKQSEPTPPPATTEQPAVPSTAPAPTPEPTPAPTPAPETGTGTGTTGDTTTPPAGGSTSSQ